MEWKNRNYIAWIGHIIRSVLFEICLLGVRETDNFCGDNFPQKSLFGNSKNRPISWKELVDAFTRA